MAGLEIYKCPSCGGDLRFDAAKGGYKCEYCASRFTLEDIEKLYGNQSGEDQQAKEEAEKEKKAEESGELLQYSCPNCGAEIVTDQSTAATFCYYCHNPVILSGRLGGDQKPDYVIPFSIDKKKALQTFETWIRQKKFVPKSFYNKDQIDKFSGVYFPYLLYSCDVEGHIDAEGKKVEKSRIGDTENITTGIYRIRREGNLKVENVAKNALKKANSVLVESVQPFGTDALKPFNMSYLSGFLAERKDMKPEDIRETVSGEVKNYAQSELQASIAGYEDISVTGDNLTIKNEGWKYALMPVWTLTYKEAGSGKLYYFSMNGQNGKVVGELPTDKNALTAYFFKIFAPVFVVLLAISYFIL